MKRTMTRNCLVATKLVPLLWLLLYDYSIPLPKLNDKLTIRYKRIQKQHTSKRTIKYRKSNHSRTTVEACTVAESSTAEQTTIDK